MIPSEELQYRESSVEKYPTEEPFLAHDKGPHISTLSRDSSEERDPTAPEKEDIPTEPEEREAVTDVPILSTDLLTEITEEKPIPEEPAIIKKLEPTLPVLKTFPPGAPATGEAQPDEDLPIEEHIPSASSDEKHTEFVEETAFTEELLITPTTQSEVQAAQGSILLAQEIPMEKLNINKLSYSIASTESSTLSENKVILVSMDIKAKDHPIKIIDEINTDQQTTAQEIQITPTIKDVDSKVTSEEPHVEDERSFPVEETSTGQPESADSIVLKVEQSEFTPVEESAAEHVSTFDRVTLQTNIEQHTVTPVEEPSVVNAELLQQEVVQPDHSEFTPVEEHNVEQYPYDSYDDDINQQIKHKLPDAPDDIFYGVLEDPTMVEIQKQLKQVTPLPEEVAGEVPQSSEQITAPKEELKGQDVTALDRIIGLESTTEAPETEHQQAKEVIKTDQMPALVEKVPKPHKEEVISKENILLRSVWEDVETPTTPNEEVSEPTTLLSEVDIPIGIETVTAEKINSDKVESQNSEMVAEIHRPEVVVVNIPEVEMHIEQETAKKRPILYTEEVTSKEMQALDLPLKEQEQYLSAEDLVRDQIPFKEYRDSTEERETVAMYDFDNFNSGNEEEYFTPPEYRDSSEERDPTTQFKYSTPAEKESILDLKTDEEINIEPLENDIEMYPSDMSFLPDDTLPYMSSQAVTSRDSSEERDPIETQTDEGPIPELEDENLRRDLKPDLLQVRIL